MTHAGGFASWLRILAALMLVLSCGTPAPCLAAGSSVNREKNDNPESAAPEDKATSSTESPKETPLKRVEFGLATLAIPRESYRTIPGKDYQLGAYDQLEVAVTGPKPEKWEATISPQGTITLPLVGTIPCAGNRVGELENKLTRAFTRYLRNFTLTVVVTQLRGIEVTLVGQVMSPGPYSLTGLTRLWEAIQRSGGITEAGSVRTVRIRSQNGKERTVDLYPFLFEGRAEANVTLDAGDSVYVPVAERVVGLSGEVRRPGLYEFKAGETLAQLLALAGSPTAQAALSKTYLERALADQTKEILRIDLRASADPASASLLRDGDALIVPSLDLFLGNVYVNGEVRNPGTYARKQKMRLSDLLALAGGCKASAALSRAYIERFQANEKPQILFVNAAEALAGKPQADLLLQEGDRIHVPDAGTLAGSVTVKGAVREPLTQPLAEGMRVSDLLNVAGGPMATAAPARAYLQRVSLHGEKTNLLFLDLNRAQAQDPAHNLPLQDGDILTVPAANVYYGKVSVSGELRAVAAAPVAQTRLTQTATDNTEKARDEGTGADVREQLTHELQFDLVEGMRVSDLLRLAGGTTATAALDRARLIRIRPDGLKEALPIDLLALAADPAGKADLPLRDGDSLYVPSIAVLQKSVIVAGELIGTGIFQSVTGVTGETLLKRRGLYELKEGDTVRDLVLAVGGVTANAALRAARIERRGAGNQVERIPVDLYRLLIQKEDQANVALQNGDEFIVPAVADMVYVVGAVNQPGAYEYREGNNRVMDMIARAGGKTQRAIMREVRLVHNDAGPHQDPIRINMDAVMRQGKIALDPGVRAGDIVFVPEKAVIMQDMLQLFASISMMRFYSGL